MMLKQALLGLLALLFISFPGYSQEKVIYKKIDTVELTLEVYRPTLPKGSGNYPALVFFFGGGWNGGSIAHFQPQAEYFSQRGMVCILVDYRVKSRQQTTPFESLKDAKSAIRYIRENADFFQLDPSKIVAAGGSAGGHLAAATALIESYNEASDDLSVSSIPNALVLFNPVIDNGPGGYGFERIGEEYQKFSPLHNIREGAPPTLILLGTKDELVPVETAKYYQKVMERVGSRCELRLYEDQIHGFFNYKNFEFYKKTVLETDDFLVSLGFLEDTPKVDLK